MSNIKIQTPQDAIKVLGEHMRSLDREVVCVLNIRSDGKPINCNFVSIGAVNECLAHPREIFKSAILANATSMLMIHNHPSGQLNPSNEDVVITDRMLKVGEILGIPVVDHVIVGGKNTSYFSMRERDMLKYEHTRYETNYNYLKFEEFHVAEQAPKIKTADMPIADNVSATTESADVPIRRKAR